MCSRGCSQQLCLLAGRKKKGKKKTGFDVDAMLAEATGEAAAPAEAPAAAPATEGALLEPSSSHCKDTTLAFHNLKKQKYSSSSFFCLQSLLPALCSAHSIA